MSYEAALFKLAEVIVGAGGQANIPFSSIDQRYRSLQVIFQGRSDAAATYAELYARFNSDTAANYDYEQLAGQNGATPSAFSSGTFGDTKAQLGFMPAASDPSGFADQYDILVANYAGTTFHKTLRSSGGLRIATSGTNMWLQLHTAWWRSTAAITSILLFPASGNFVAGSVASLYGLL